MQWMYFGEDGGDGERERWRIKVFRDEKDVETKYSVENGGEGICLVCWCWWDDDDPQVKMVKMWVRIKYWHFVGYVQMLSFVLVVGYSESRVLGKNRDRHDEDDDMVIEKRSYRFFGV